MNDMAAKKQIEYYEIIHKPWGKTVAYACPFCMKIFNAQEDLAIAGSECGLHVQTCEKRPAPAQETP